MGKKRVVILGGGISGLAAGFYLSQAPEKYELLLIEKENRLGGWIQTESNEGFLFEKGPRTLKTSRSQALLELANDLGLQNQLIYSVASAEKRYLFAEGRLRKMGGLWTLRKFCLPIIREWFVPPSENDNDESVWDFAVRRFNEPIAQFFFDPLVTGIFAGDSKKTSLKAAFPAFHRWEKEYGSLIKAMLKQKGPKKAKGLFSFRGGMTTLIQSLEKKFSGKIQLGTKVVAINQQKSEIKIETDQGSYSADIVICALPYSAAASLFNLPEMKSETLSVINMGYGKRTLPFSAFGYLVPSSEKQQILGAVFDSEIFPDHNQSKEETRLTVMMRNGHVAMLLSELEKHLGIKSLPDVFSVTHAENAIPQYGIGHVEKIANIEEQMAKKFPDCILIGNYLRGASVNECVVNAKRAAQHLLNSSAV